MGRSKRRKIVEPRTGHPKPNDEVSDVAHATLRVAPSPHHEAPV